MGDERSVINDCDDVEGQQEQQKKGGDDNCAPLAENNDERPHNNTSTTNSSSTSPTRHYPLATTEHLIRSRQYWRDIILGVNDGLVSTFLLVAGVVGGGMSSREVLLTAISGALAGAISMCAGEYVATKSQNEVLHGEIALEQRHISVFRDDEMAELGGLLNLIGIPEEENDVREPLMNYYRSHPHALLRIMIALEFGVLEEEERSPVHAGLISCGLFLLGAMPSVIPFIFSGDKPNVGLISAAAATATGLLLVGTIKTWASRGNCWKAAIENLAIAGIGGGFAYGIGTIFNLLVAS